MIFILCCVLACLQKHTMELGKKEARKRAKKEGAIAQAAASYSKGGNVRKFKRKR
jgi:hypothetical protein